MKKKYEVVRDFGVGECNLQLKKSAIVEYDISTGSLIVEDDKYTANNLKSAINAKWLVPVDGKYPKLDGPIGETQDEAAERKRKERFALQESKKKDNPKLLKDEREVGVVDESSDIFLKILNAEPVASAKSKVSKKMELIEDDTRVVADAIVEDKETKALKKALRQDPSDKKPISEIKVYHDHYDAETVKVGEYKDTSNEAALGQWPEMHWTKKAEVIQFAKDKKFLSQLKTLETSPKIKERIEKRLEVL